MKKESQQINPTSFALSSFKLLHFLFKIRSISSLYMSHYHFKLWELTQGRWNGESLLNNFPRLWQKFHFSEYLFIGSFYDSLSWIKCKWDKRFYWSALGGEHKKISSISNLEKNFLSSALKYARNSFILCLTKILFCLCANDL